MSDYILEMNHIAKVYGNGVVANSDVNFNLKKGEIHALSRLAWNRKKVYL